MMTLCRWMLNLFRQQWPLLSMALRAPPVGGASDGVDPGCDGGQEVLEDVLAAAVLVEVLRASALFCALPLAAPSAKHTTSLSEFHGLRRQHVRLIVPLWLRLVPGCAHCLAVAGATPGQCCAAGDMQAWQRSFRQCSTPTSAGLRPEQN